MVCCVATSSPLLVCVCVCTCYLIILCVREIRVLNSPLDRFSCYSEWCVVWRPALSCLCALCACYFYVQERKWVCLLSQMVVYCTNRLCLRSLDGAGETRSSILSLCILVYYSVIMSSGEEASGCVVWCIKSGPFCWCPLPAMGGSRRHIMARSILITRLPGIMCKGNKLNKITLTSVRKVREVVSGRHRGGGALHPCIEADQEDE